MLLLREGFLLLRLALDCCGSPAAALPTAGTKSTLLSLLVRLAAGAVHPGLVDLRRDARVMHERLSSALGFQA